MPRSFILLIRAKPRSSGANRSLIGDRIPQTPWVAELRNYYRFEIITADRRFKVLGTSVVVRRCFKHRKCNKIRISSEKIEGLLKKILKLARM